MATRIYCGTDAPDRQWIAKTTRVTGVVPNWNYDFLRFLKTSMICMKFLGVSGVFDYAGPECGHLAERGVDNIL
jgi:hypothetical protein